MDILTLPFSGETPISRHCSAMAAQAAARSRATKTLQYLQLLAEAGERGLSDHDTRDATAWPMSSITSIRGGLGELVVPADTTGISPYGRTVTRWRKK